MKLLLTHTDPDGITPVILLKLVENDFEHKSFEAPELSKFILDELDTDYFDKFDVIYIVDLGINKECACKIVNSKYKDKFKLFDHHETNEHLNIYDFATVIEEVDGFKECGTSIFYKYLVDTYKNDILTKESVITFVELIRENDTWQFTDFEKEAHDLSTLFSFYGKDTYIDIYTNFLKNNDKFFFTKTELIILKSLNRTMQEYLKNMEDKVIIKNINGYNVGIVFAERYRSNLGNHLANVYKDQVDFICIINLSRHISLRGIKEDKPVNKFAEIYGGGGHPNASAISYPKDLHEKVVDYIFGILNENK